MRDADEETDASSSWRSELSNVCIWYASYGSNMWKSRLSCYIAGGQVMKHSSQVAFFTLHLKIIYFISLILFFPFIY